MGTQLTVECHSGYTYAERPAAFYFEGHRLVVEEIESQWRYPQGLCFCVRTTDGQFFILKYRENEDQWLVNLT